MLPRRMLKSTGFPLLAFGCIAFAHPAEASFQWVAPTQQAAPAPSPAPAPLIPYTAAGPADAASAPVSAPSPVSPSAPIVIAPSAAVNTPAPAPVQADTSAAGQTGVASAPILAPTPMPLADQSPAPVIVPAPTPVVAAPAAPQPIAPTIISGSSLSQNRTSETHEPSTPALAPLGLPSSSSNAGPDIQEPITPVVVTGSSSSTSPSAPASAVTPVVLPEKAADPLPAPSSIGPEIMQPITIDSTTSSSATQAPILSVSPEAEAKPVIADEKPVSDSGEIPVYNGPVAELASSPAPIASAAGQTGVTAAPIAVPSVTLSGNGDSGSLVLPPAVTTAPPTAVSTDVVHGFAKGVPVVVALRQLLPKGYAFTIDKNVNAKTLVSYKGGKPWRATLQGALQPVGLVMHEQDQIVEVSRAGAKPSTPPADIPVTTAAPLYQPGQAPHDLDATMEAPVPGVDTTSSSDVKSVPPVLVPSASVAVPAVDTMSKIGATWTADRGSSLHRVLEVWCKRAHVEFNWVAEYDYPLDASVSYDGSFADAVRSLLTGFENAHPQPVAELHSNPTLGQMVLVVSTRGNTNSD